MKENKIIAAGMWAEKPPNTELRCKTYFSRVEKHKPVEEAKKTQERDKNFPAEDNEKTQEFSRTYWVL